MDSKRWFEEHLKRGWRREGVLGRGERRIVTLALLALASRPVGREEGMEGIPFANSISPAVSSARVASLGRWSRTTEAAIVMGRVASALSASGSGGTEEGEGGDGEEECGWEEAMVVSVGVLASCSVLLFLAVGVSVWEGELRSGGELLDPAFLLWW